MMKKIFFILLAIMSSHIFAYEFDINIKCSVDGHYITVSTSQHIPMFDEEYVAKELRNRPPSGVVIITTPDLKTITYKVVLVGHNEFNDYIVQAFAYSFNGLEETVNINYPSEDGNQATITLKRPWDLIDGVLLDNLHFDKFKGYGHETLIYNTLTSRAEGTCEIQK